jgi:sec-independent protein translocase protein TatA
MGLSLSHILLVGIVVFLLFGAGRLPSLMTDLAKGLRAFKSGLKEEEETPPLLTKTSKRKKHK